MRSSLLVAFCLLAAGAAEAQDLNVISAVEVRPEGNGVVVTVKGSKPPNFTTFSMADPARFVIDLSESKFQGVPEDLRVDDGVIRVIKNLSYGSGATAIARVMLAFAVDVEPPDVQTDGNSLVVKVPRPAGAAVAAGGGAAPAAGAPAAAGPTKAEEEAAARQEALAKEKREAEAREQARLAAESSAKEREVRAQAEAAARAREAEKAAAEQAAADQAAAAAAEARRAEIKAKAAAEQGQAQPPAAAAPAEETEAQAQARADAQAKKEIEEELARQAAEAKAAEAKASGAQAAEAQAAAARAAEAKAAEARAAETKAAEARAAEARAAEAQAAAARAAEARAAETQAAAAQAAAARAAEVRAAAAKAAEARAAEKTAPAAAAAPRTAPPVASAAAEPAATPSRPAKLQAVGFTQLPAVSRVFVKTSVAPRFTITDVGDDVVRLEVENTRVSRRNDTRPLDTSFFQSAVAMITPSRQGTSYVVDIKLKKRVPYQQKVEGSVLSIDFERPPAPAGAAEGEATTAPAEARPGDNRQGLVVEPEEQVDGLAPTDAEPAPEPAPKQ